MFKQIVIVSYDVECVEVLTLVFVESFYLNVKNTVRIDLEVEIAVV